MVLGQGQRLFEGGTQPAALLLVHSSLAGRCREGVGMRKQYHFWPGRSGLDAWDVDRLIRLTAELPVERVAVADVAELDSVYWFDDWHRPTVRNVVEHCRLMQEVETSYPVILGPDGRVMDGMHRIARALAEGRAVVDAVRFEVLPPADHLDCRPQDLPYDRPGGD